MVAIGTRWDAILYDKLKDNAAHGAYPMHMPGHKRNTELLPPGLPYDIDITEIHGFDDLHDPRGVLLETADIAAQLYGSEKAFLLINGSTVGMLAAIGAHAKRGDKLLITANCHRSAENAADIFGLETICIEPETGDGDGIARSIDPGAVGAALEKERGIGLVVITSPTYEGVISDIAAIAGIAHKYDVPLLVDSAHGAHLGFSRKFPDSAVRAGADIVVMSLHKTLPALTQCSLLHICGERANAAETARLLSILQTSSPSYVLLASIDRCLRMILSDKDRLFSEYERRLDRFGDGVSGLKKLSVLGYGGDESRLGFFALDPGKIVVLTQKTALDGFMLADILRTKHKIELEMARPGYAVAMTSICDSEEGFARLADALRSIDDGA